MKKKQSNLTSQIFSVDFAAMNNKFLNEEAKLKNISVDSDRNGRYFIVFLFTLAQTTSII
jgi:hypothetical protein